MGCRNMPDNLEEWSTHEDQQKKSLTSRQIDETVPNKKHRAMLEGVLEIQS